MRAVNGEWHSTFVRAASNWSVIPHRSQQFTDAPLRHNAAKTESVAFANALEDHSGFNFSPLALHLLVWQCMTLTLDDIIQHEERMRHEIMERECLLAALGVLRNHFTAGQVSKPIELSSLTSAFLPSQPAIPSPEPTSCSPATPPGLPDKPPTPPYVHPDLQGLANRFGQNGQAVSWAIERMTDDYSLRDIAALLKREGHPMRSAEISVVLTRLKKRGEIEETAPGHGPIPAVFRKVHSAPPETESQQTAQAVTEPRIEP